MHGMCGGIEQYACLRTHLLILFVRPCCVVGDVVIIIAGSKHLEWSVGLKMPTIFKKLWDIIRIRSSLKLKPSFAPFVPQHSMEENAMIERGVRRLYVWTYLAMAAIIQWAVRGLPQICWMRRQKGVMRHGVQISTIRIESLPPTHISTRTHTRTFIMASESRQPIRIAI